jgi:starch phosphorylase
MVDWQHALETASIRFGELKIATNAEQHMFEVQVYLTDLDPNATRVELYADGIDGTGPVRQQMERAGQMAGADSGYIYRTQVPSTRPATEYSARVLPHFDGAAVPLEAARILWQR